MLTLLPELPRQVKSLWTCVAPDAVMLRHLQVTNKKSRGQGSIRDSAIFSLVRGSLDSCCPYLEFRIVSFNYFFFNYLF